MPWLTVGVVVGAFWIALPLVFVMVANSNPHSWLGRLLRPLTVATSGLWRLLHVVVGARVSRAVHATVHYLFASRNRVLFLVYNIGIPLGVAHYFMIGAPHIPPGHDTMWYTYYALLAVVYPAMVYGVAFSDPGIVTKDNVQHLSSLYAYDGALFPKPQVCRTCRVVKPARSKHCKLCNVCVSKMDHHCAWANNCIGANNYRWFLLFLLTNVLMWGIFCVMTGWTLVSIAVEHRLAHMQYKNHETGQWENASARYIFSYLRHKHEYNVAHFLISCSLGFMVTLFTLYHVCWIAACNNTTNERAKRTGLVGWRSHMRSQLLQKGTTLTTTDVTEMHAQLEDRHISCVGTGFESGWFRAARPQGMVRVVGETKPQRDARLAKATDWTPHEVSFPFDDADVQGNPYHRGVWANMYEVMYPLHLRGGSGASGGSPTQQQEPQKKMHPKKKKKKKKTS